MSAELEKVDPQQVLGLAVELAQAAHRDAHSGHSPGVALHGRNCPGEACNRTLQLKRACFRVPSRDAQHHVRSPWWRRLSVAQILVPCASPEEAETSKASVQGPVEIPIIRRYSDRLASRDSERVARVA